MKLFLYVALGATSLYFIQQNRALSRRLTEVRIAAPTPAVQLMAPVQVAPTPTTKPDRFAGWGTILGSPSQPGIAYVPVPVGTSVQVNNYDYPVRVDGSSSLNSEPRRTAAVRVAPTHARTAAASPAPAHKYP